MFFYGSRGANDPRIDDDQPVGDAQPILDDRTGKAALDGYTRLSIADRATGQRPLVDGRPVMFPGRPYEDHR